MSESIAAKPAGALSSRGLLNASLLVAVFFGLDKLAGLGRQILVAKYFGLNPVLDAYNTANNLPDLLFALISGGALAMAFIPVLTDTLNRDGNAAAWRLVYRSPGRQRQPSIAAGQASHQPIGEQHGAHDDADRVDGYEAGGLRHQDEASKWLVDPSRSSEVPDRHEGRGDDQAREQTDGQQQVIDVQARRGRTSACPQRDAAVDALLDALGVLGVALGTVSHALPCFGESHAAPPIVSLLSIIVAVGSAVATRIWARSRYLGACTHSRTFP
jgi:hypothetical protein